MTRRLKPPHNDPATVARLVAQYEGLRCKIVNHMRRRKLPLCLERDELEQMSRLALWRAAELWDDSKRAKSTGKPVKFITYAFRSIRRRLWRLVDEYCHLPKQEPRSIPQHFFDRPGAVGRYYDPDGSTLYFAETVPGRERPPQDRATERELWSSLARHLDPRTARILYLTYFAGCNLKEVGDLLGISRERVRQIHDRAIARLRQKMGVPTPPPRVKRPHCVPQDEPPLPHELLTEDMTHGSERFSGVACPA